MFLGSIVDFFHNLMLVKILFEILSSEDFISVVFKTQNLRFQQRIVD